MIFKFINLSYLFLFHVYFLGSLLVFCVLFSIRSTFLFLGHCIGDCIGQWKTTKLSVRTISPSQSFPTRPTRSLSRPARHSSCVAVNWSPARDKACLTSRQFWLVKCRESKERRKFFCCGNAEKLKSFDQGHIVGRNYSKFFHLLVRIHQIRMF